MIKLYFDDSRCVGYCKVPTFKRDKPDDKDKCVKADQCARYLQREVNIGPRTASFLPSDTLGCDMFLDAATGR